jgi:hypothetical protein
MITSPHHPHQTWDSGRLSSVGELPLLEADNSQHPVQALKMMTL